MSHDFVIELREVTDVESETSHLTAHFAILGLVPKIVGTTRHEFCDVIPSSNSLVMSSGKSPIGTSG